MDIRSAQTKVQAADVPIESLAGNSNISQDDKIGEVARQFEAILVRQMLTEARKSESSGNKVDDGIYNDMVNTQLADSMTRDGGFGLAQSLKTQLTHQVLHYGQPLKPLRLSGEPLKPLEISAQPLKPLQLSPQSPTPLKHD